MKILRSPRAIAVVLAVLMAGLGAALVLSESARRTVKHGLRRLQLQVEERSETAAVAWWESAEPEQEGFDTTALEALGDSLARRGTTSLLIARRDRIVYERYAPGSGADERHGIAAAAKPLVAGMVLLLTLQDGRLELDDPVSQFVPSWKDDPRKSRVTVRHLATHTSGMIDVPFLGEDGARQTVDWKRTYERDPATRFRAALELAPLVSDPGERYRYSGVGYHVLAYVLAACRKGEPGSDARELLARRLFAPLGIPDGAWRISYGRAYDLDGLRLYSLGSGASLTTRAIARIGQLMLHEGTWRGTEIFSSRWLGEFLRCPLSPQPPLEIGIDEPPAGVGWFLNTGSFFPSLPPDAYIAAGAGHNILLVVPSLDLLVVRTGRSLGRGFWEPLYWKELETYLFRPLRSALPPEVER